ncbi:hypothetical protein HYX06_01075 [Candidatus Woesearchaeota archaeon]|nr:hypothetical protein [Candidatus Woesearchaeota archaeon]
MFRKLLMWLVKNIFVLLLVTFIFSAVAFDVPGMIKGIFKDIFQYASPDAQKDVVGKLTLACSSLDGRDISGLQQMTGPVSIDFSRIGSFCKDYNTGKINDREFFFDVVGSAIPDRIEAPKAGILDKYNSVMDFLNKNKIYYIVILLALLALLYLLAGNLNAFVAILSGISLSMGILILIPYAAIIAYEKFVGFDTTPILSSVLQGSFSFDPKAIASVVLLMILRTYTSFIVALGAVFLGAGIAGKVYIRRLNKNPKSEARADKKSEKESKEEKPKKEKPKEKRTKEEEEEAYKHRDRSTKEILDELEDIHKKKLNKKEE